MFKLLLLPIRLPLKTARLALRLTGLSNVLMLGIGLGIGLLAAPTTGAEMRRRLKERIDERRGGGPETIPAHQPEGFTGP